MRALAPKTLDTLAQLQGRRPQERVMEIPPEVVEFVPDRPFELDHALFTKCLQSAPSGCAPDPGGCSNEMLRVCLDDGSIPVVVPSSRGLCICFHARKCEEGFHVRQHECTSKTRRRSARHCYLHFFPLACCQNSGQTVRKSSGINLCSVPVRLVHTGWHRLRGHVVRALTDENPMVMLSIDGGCLRPRVPERNNEEVVQCSESERVASVRPRNVGEPHELIVGR